jgi:DNA-binding beta-propeller fold protein YncE
MSARRYLFILILLAGCAGPAAQPAVSPFAATPANATRPSGDALPGSYPHRNVLYVSDVLDSKVDVYPLNTNDPAPIGEIVLGIDTPTGMALDSAHNLYVANNATRSVTGIRKGMSDIMPVYPPGGGASIWEYAQGLRHPTDVVVGSDGTVYAASFADGYITEFAKGSLTPSLHFQPPFGMAFAVALDAQNNLYVACTTANTIFEFAPGSTQGTNLGLLLGGEPHGMAFDASGNLLVAVSKAPGSGSVVDVFPPGSTTPSKQITGPFQPFMIDFDKTRRHLYVADFGSGNHDGAVFEFAYPSGKLVTKYTQGGASAAYGVAVNPPASP